MTAETLAKCDYCPNVDNSDFDPKISQVIKELQMLSLFGDLGWGINAEMNS